MLNDDRQLKLFGPAVLGFAALTFAMTVFLTLGLFLYGKHQDNALRDSQVRACERLGNPRARQISRNADVLRELLRTARAARLESARIGSGEQASDDRATARKYSRLSYKLKPVAQANCELVYPKP